MVQGWQQGTISPHPCQKSIAGHSFAWLCLNIVNDSGCSLWMFAASQFIETTEAKRWTGTWEGTNGPGREAGDQFQLPNQHTASLNTSVAVNR